MQVNRVSSLSVVLIMLGIARAESPSVTLQSVNSLSQAAQAQPLFTASAIDAARDPESGVLRLDSEPMQCAISCQQQVDRRVTLCVEKTPDPVDLDGLRPVRSPHAAR